MSIKSRYYFHILSVVGIFFLYHHQMLAKVDSLNLLVYTIKERYAPDDRFSVFSVYIKKSATGIIIAGDVDNVLAKRALIDTLKQCTKSSIIDDINVLPEAALQDSTYGIVTLSVADVRKHPDNRDEMTTQVLMGTIIKLLKNGGYYWLVQMPDGYIGWLKKISFERTNADGVERWNTAKKAIMTEYFGIIYSEQNVSSMPVSDIVLGCTIKDLGESNGWMHAELADGRNGFVSTGAVKNLDEWRKSTKLTTENIEKTAAHFLGFPYLWGGASIKGFDCSGFVKTVFMMNGKEMLRDADRQATMGIPVDPGTSFENLRKGDLLFFGRKSSNKNPERITHVAIYLGNKLFIHSSGRVRFSSFDSTSPLYEDSLLKIFIRARRIIPE